MAEKFNPSIKTIPRSFADLISMYNRPTIGGKTANRISDTFHDAAIGKIDCNSKSEKAEQWSRTHTTDNYRLNCKIGQEQYGKYASSRSYAQRWDDRQLFHPLLLVELNQAKDHIGRFDGSVDML